MRHLEKRLERLENAIKRCVIVFNTEKEHKVVDLLMESIEYEMASFAVDARYDSEVAKQASDIFIDNFSCS